MGTVDDPSSDEWGEAYHAPSKPYAWTDNSRVTIRQFGPVYVERASDSDTPGKIITSRSPLTEQERSELEILERVVIEGELYGGLFPLYVRSYQDYTGNEVTGAVKRLAAQVEKLVEQRRVFTPAMMAIVIREYIRESDRREVDPPCDERKPPKDDKDRL